MFISTVEMLHDSALYKLTTDINLCTDFNILPTLIVDIVNS